MTMSEDEDVGVDLSAWEAPPPASGLADAVLAKMREPVHAAALEPTEPSRLRWWLAGGAVAAVAVAMIAVFASRGSESLTGSGAVAVAKPSRIDLGAASGADLEANTDVRWVRDGHRLVAMQPRGTANWKVSPDDKLVIDAGATVASVVATGASLRVEVHPMHVTEAKLMAGSALVSAAVALVTVVVYEGHVEVTGGGRTTTVAPGATVEIRPHTPPREPVPVAEVVDDANRATGAAPKQVRLDANGIEKMMASQRAALTICGGAYAGTLKVMMTIAPSGKVTEVMINPTNARPATCVAKLVRGLDFGPNQGGMFGYTLELEPDKRTATVKNDPACADVAWVQDAEAKGDTSLQQGAFAAALQFYQSIFKCKPGLVQKLYLAACRARQFPEAKSYFQMFPANKRDSMAQICMKEGFDARGP